MHALPQPTKNKNYDLSQIYIIVQLYKDKNNNLKLKIIK